MLLAAIIHHAVIFLSRPRDAVAGEAARPGRATHRLPATEPR